MTGEIIRFESLRDHRKAGSRAGRTVPSGPCPQDLPVGDNNLQGLERHIGRVARLLEELEAMTRTFKNIPPDTRQRALVLAKRARWVVQPWSRGNAPYDPDDGLEGDPQPVIDNERVERMYRDLNSDR